MKSRTVLSALVLALAIPAAYAQSTDPEKAAPPDTTAYQEANRIDDPARKIEALEKFKKDFPDSPSVISANVSILATLTSRMPDQTARIQKLAKEIYQGGKDKKEKGSLSAQIAEALLANNVLLKDAEKYAKTSLSALNQAQFIADQKAQFAKRSAGHAASHPPTEADLIKRFNQSRASRLATLGRVEFELGKTAEAQKLLDESWSADHDQPGAAATLGEIAAQHGDNVKALDYLVTARLAGHAPPSAMEALVSIYGKTHNGSSAGLNSFLDAEYNKRFPNPVHLDAWRPNAKRTGRLVLAEVFTGSGCPPCAGADLAFDAAMERYSRKDFAVVMYHQHIPRPDPMTNLDTQARAKYYDIHAAPTYFIDGASVKFNGASREGSKSVFEHIQTPIEKELETAAEAKIAVQASASGNAVKVAASVDAVKSESKDLRIQILLLEKELTYSGENGIRFHPMVVRAMGGESDNGFALQAGAPVSVEQAWDLDKVSAGLKSQIDDYEAKGHRGSSFKFIEKNYRIDGGNLAIVVIVEDAKTKHILQSAFVDLNPPAQRVTTGNANEPK